MQYYGIFGNIQWSENVPLCILCWINHTWVLCAEIKYFNRQQNWTTGGHNYWTRWMIIYKYTYHFCCSNSYCISLNSESVFIKPVYPGNMVQFRTFTWLSIVSMLSLVGMNFRITKSKGYAKYKYTWGPPTSGKSLKNSKYHNLEKATRLSHKIPRGGI